MRLYHPLTVSLGLLAANLAATLACTATPGGGATSGVVTPRQTSRSPLPGAPAGVIAFVNVAVVPMDTERVLEKQTVLVERGYLTALGPSATVPVPPGATRIDGQGKYLIPGLADMHAHLSPTTDSLAFERVLLQLVANGVTTIRNMDADELARGSPEGDLLRWRARAASGTLWSPRIYTTGVVGCRDATPATIAAEVARYQAAGYDLIKIRQSLNHGNCDARLFDSLTAAARRHEMPFAGHVLIDEMSLEHALVSGMRSIEHLMGYFEHLLGIPPGGRYSTMSFRQSSKQDSAFLASQRQRLAEAYRKIPAIAAATRDAGVWNCPALFRTKLSGSPVTPTGVSMLAGSGYTETLRRLIQGLQAAGAGLLLGTDAGASAVHHELALFVQAGLTPYKALATGTRNPAAYFGTLDSVGTIAVGQRADLVLLYGNPLADIRHTKQPAGVMLGGRWLSRAELDQRLAGPPAERKPYYQAYAGDAYTSLLVEWRLSFSDTGWEAIRPFRSAHKAQQAALADSLAARDAADAGATLVSAQQRLLQLVARQAGEVRATRSPTQQARFDSLAQLWVQDYTRRGYRVARFMDPARSRAP